MEDMEEELAWTSRMKKTGWPVMAVFAIADLHLSHVDEKSMDIFGRHWKGPWDKIQQAWRSRSALRTWC